MTVGAKGARRMRKRRAGARRRVTTRRASEGASRIGAKSGQPQIMRAEAKFAAHASRAMVQTVREGRTEVILRLRPETLGPVKIELSMEDGRMNARLESSNPAARELLGASLDHLRGALEARGLSVDRIEVVAPAEPEGAQAGGTNPDQHGGSSAGEHGRREDHGAARESVGEPAAEPWESERRSPRACGWSRAPTALRSSGLMRRRDA
ncbi:MAG: flagellar hook-length control protein FliK [Holophagaceae bacterium]|nr:flagellar hook-length control protein FliK [Holophagaceae bacterium]